MGVRKKQTGFTVCGRGEGPNSNNATTVGWQDLSTGSSSSSLIFLARLRTRDLWKTLQCLVFHKGDSIASAMAHDAPYLNEHVRETVPSYGSVEPSERAQEQRESRALLVCARVICSASSFFEGFIDGFVSVADLFIKSALNLTDFEYDPLDGIYFFFFCVGGLFSGYLADSRGRLFAMSVSLFCYIFWHVGGLCRSGISRVLRWVGLGWRRCWCGSCGKHDVLHGDRSQGYSRAVRGFGRGFHPFGTGHRLRCQLVLLLLAVRMELE